MNYFDIAWSSKKDGPGTRTVLFLQGCNLHCIWCHSPHSQPKCPPVLFYKDYCKKCGKCEECCEIGNHIVSRQKHLFKRDGCTFCEKCILSCPNNALEYKFYKETPEAVFEKLKPELMLLRDIGGITVSGGEPLLQYTELKELLKLCKSSGIHTAVETCAAVDKVFFEETYAYVDCWLFGLKQTDKKLCKSMTGADFDMIINNLIFLAKKAPEKIIIRMPLITGFTDDTANIQSIAGIMKSNNINNLQLLPYNPFTANFYKAAGIPFDEKRFTIPTDSMLGTVLDSFISLGINAAIV